MGQQLLIPVLLTTKYTHIKITTCSVCPLIGNGTLPVPPPLSPASVPLPRQGGGHTRLRVRRWGSPYSDDCSKSLALYLLCASDSDPPPRVKMAQKSVVPTESTLSWYLEEFAKLPNWQNAEIRGWGGSDSRNGQNSRDPVPLNITKKRKKN